MPQSLSLVIVHFVWSTKERYPFINEESRKSLHSYLATLCQDLGCHCFEVDGTTDHVHVATTLPRTLSQADLVEDAKRSPRNGSRRKGVLVWPKSSPGSEVTRHSQSARASYNRSCDRFKGRKYTTHVSASRTSTENCSSAMGWSLTSATSGTSALEL